MVIRKTSIKTPRQYRSVRYSKRQFTKGFTLIELMLATSLLMMVMFSGYYAYSLYSQKWQKRVQVFWRGTEHAIALDSLHKILASAHPYMVNGKGDKASVYFKGTNTSVSFISNSAIFSKGPALVQLRLEGIPNSSHSNLVYQEQSIKENLVLDIEHQANWQHEIVLLANITDFNLSYYGWKSFQQAVENATSDLLFKDEHRSWYQNHQSDISRILPEKVQVSFTDNNGESQFELPFSQHSIYRLLTYIREGV